MEYMSAGIKEITGYNAEDIINNKKLPYNELIVPEDRDRIWHEIQLAIEKRKAFEVNYKIKIASGELRYFSEKGIGIYDNESGELIALEGFINDVTKNKLVDKALRSSEERYKSLVTNLPIGIFRSTYQGKILSANPAMAEIYGYSCTEELLDVPAQEYYTSDNQREIMLTELEKKGQLLQYETLENKKDGTLVWVSTNYKGIYNDNNELLYIDGAVIDITEGKKTEDALKLSEEKNRSITQTAADAIISINDEGIILSWNTAAEKIFGYSAKEMLMNNLSKIIPNKYISGHESGLNRLKEGGRKKLIGETVEISAIRKSGTEFPIELSLSMWESDNQKYFTGIIRDITKRRKAENELLKSETRFKHLFDGLGDAVFVTKIGGKNSGNILEVNMAAINQTGYSRDELLKMNIINDLYVEGTGDINTKAWEEKLLKGETVTTTEKKRKKDGTEYWTEIIVSYIDFKGKKASLSINHDITSRKRYEQIQKSLFQISNAVITTDNLEQLIGLIQLELGTIIDTTNFYVALYEPSNDTISLPFMTDEKDVVTSFPAGKTLTNYVIKTKQPLLATSEKLTLLEESGHIETFSSNSEIWLGVPLKIEGEVTGVLAVQSYTDKNAYTELDMEILVFVSDQISISIERKKKEQKLLSALEKATESDRLKSAFLATISHELRTPLNAIIGFSDLIDTSLPIEDVYDYTKIINSSGIHLLNIVEDLFDITLIESGETKINKKEVEINSFLNDINKAIIIEQNKLEKNNINLNLIIPNSDEKVILFTDSLKLKQIFNNLLKNALKFTHNGHINFGFGIEEIQGKSYCKFYVQDTGIGISKDKHDVIFDIFRQIDDSHTRTYEGTGIGLSISKKLTELLGGKIWLESEEDVGSAFYFTIPYEGKVVIDPKNEKTIVEEGSLKSKTILIVEDDPDSLEFLKILLEMANINSYWAHSGEEAIKYCHENMSIDLVLMDINMSGINGYEATKEIKKFRPKLPIIAQTAYAFGGDKEKALDVGCDDYISKPIDKEELMEMITKLVSD